MLCCICCWRVEQTSMEHDGRPELFWSGCDWLHRRHILEVEKSHDQSPWMLLWITHDVCKAVSISVCSVTSSCFDQNPFCFFLSRYSLESRNEYNFFFISDARILYQTACSVMGRKFLGSDVSPFLFIKIVALCFQHSGIRLDRQHLPMMRCNMVLAFGHFCRMRIESWPIGPADASRLAFRFFFWTYSVKNSPESTSLYGEGGGGHRLTTSLYVDGDSSNGDPGWSSLGIQLGMTNLVKLDTESTPRKKLSYSMIENVGRLSVALLKISWHVDQNFCRRLFSRLTWSWLSCLFFKDDWIRLLTYFISSRSAWVDLSSFSEDLSSLIGGPILIFFVKRWNSRCNCAVRRFEIWVNSELDIWNNVVEICWQLTPIVFVEYRMNICICQIPIRFRLWDFSSISIDSLGGFSGGCRDCMNGGSVRVNWWNYVAI